MTRVACLRYRGEGSPDDVDVTRNGPWGNPYPVDAIDPESRKRDGDSRIYGWRALELYRRFLRSQVDCAVTMGSRAPPRWRKWLEDLRGLAGKTLRCSCLTECPCAPEVDCRHEPAALACHAWILAEEVQRLTGVPVEPAPGRERP